MRQFSNVTNKRSRATDFLRSTGLNDDSPRIISRSGPPSCHVVALTKMEVTRVRDEGGYDA